MLSILDGWRFYYDLTVIFYCLSSLARISRKRYKKVYSVQSIACVRAGSNSSLLSHIPRPVYPEEPVDTLHDISKYFKHHFITVLLIRIEYSLLTYQVQEVSLLNFALILIKDNFIVNIWIRCASVFSAYRFELWMIRHIEYFKYVDVIVNYCLQIRIDLNNYFTTVYYLKMHNTNTLNNLLIWQISP